MTLESLACRDRSSWGSAPRRSSRRSGTAPAFHGPSTTCQIGLVAKVAMSEPCFCRKFHTAFAPAVVSS